MACGLFFLGGCDRGGKPAEGPSAKPPAKADPPSIYMKDPAFRKALDAKESERREILVSREKLFEEMERRVDAMRAKMPGAKDPEVKKELEKDPEWNSLMRRIKDANEAFNDNRRSATKLVSERLRPHPAEKR